MEPHHVVTSIAGILQLLLIAQVLGSVGTVLLTVVFHNLALRSIGQIKAPDPAPGFIVQVCLKFEGVEAHTSEFKSAQRLVSRLSADPRNFERCTQPRRPLARIRSQVFTQPLSRKQWLSGSAVAARHNKVIDRDHELSERKQAFALRKRQLGRHTRKILMCKHELEAVRLSAAPP